MMTNVNFSIQKEPVPVLVKVGEVAKLLSVSRHTVHSLIDSGELSASKVTPPPRKRVRPRRHVRITRDSLLKFYQKRFGHPLKQALDNPFAA